MTEFEIYLKYYDFKKSIYEKITTQLSSENIDTSWCDVDIFADTPNNVRQNYFDMYRVGAIGYNFNVMRTYGSLKERYSAHEIESLANEVVDKVMDYVVRFAGISSDIECFLVEATQEVSNYRVNVNFSFFIPNHNIENIDEIHKHLFISKTLYYPK